MKKLAITSNLTLTIKPFKIMASGQKEKPQGEKNFWRTKITDLKGGKKKITFRKSCDEGTENAQSEVSNGKTYWFLESDWLQGKITRLFFWTNENNDGSKSWDVLSIDLTDEKGVTECLTINMSSGECQDFLRRVPNINPQLEVKLQAYTIENDKGYWNNYLVSYQNEAKIESWYTKENPLPEIKEVMSGDKPLKVNGKSVWDKSARLEALKQCGLDFNKRLQGQHEYTAAETGAGAKTAAKTKDKK